MTNKAHAAVVRRLVERYGCSTDGDGFDLHVGNLIIEVETSATVCAAVARLQTAAGRRYIAVTNREAIPDALTATSATGIGVMDPWGEILRDAAPAS